MKRHIFHAAVLFSLVMLTQLVALPAAQAAPGDFLFLWGAQQHFADPSGIAIDGSGNVFVTDTSSVQVFNSSGVRLRKWGTYGSGDGQLIYPRGVAIGKNGMVYVVDAGNNRIQVFDSAGKFLGKWRSGWSDNTIDGIAIDANGNVYVADPGSYDGDTGDYLNDSVKVFDSEGNFLRQLGSHGTGTGQFRAPTGVAVGVNGNVYVADNGNSRVQLFGPTGAFIRTAVADVFIWHGMAVDRNGNIFVSSDAGGNPFGVVKVFDSSGNLFRELKFTEDYYAEHYWIPIAVAVDKGGNAYVLDTENAGLRAFDTAGNLLGQWWTYGTGDAQLDRPTGIAVARNGEVYETDGQDKEDRVFNDRVRIFDGEGKFLRGWHMELRASTSGIAVDQGGKVYVLETSLPDLDTTASSVQVFDGLGTLLREWGSFGSDPGQFADPFGIAVDASGNVLVADTGNSRVQIFDNTGNLLKVLGSAGTGNGQFVNPEGIAVDGNGYIFVVDSGNSRVQVFNSAYNFVRKWGSAGFSNGFFSHPSGIAIDGNDNVFVADAGNNWIQVFNSTGSFLRKWGGEGDDSSLFREPRGVSVSQSGARVYVADTGNNRIQVFEGFGPASYSISGTVRQGSATGPALAGATVAIAGKTATTSSTGTFSVTGIPAGSYTLTISKTGFITKTSTGYVVDDNRSGLVFYLSAAPTFSMSGTVRQGSATGPVLAGATVAIAGKTSTTSSTGTFSISGILAGTYSPTISKDGFITKTIAGYVLDSNKSGLVFYLSAAPRYSMSGSLRQGSATGPVLAGATVAIAGKSVTTSSAGTFSITGILAGSYTLTISKTGYLTKTMTGYLVNSNKSGLVFYLTAVPKFSISGTVRRWSATGPVLPGATVAIAGKTAITSSSGSFSITGIPAGSYTLTISKAGCVTKRMTGYLINSNKSGLVFYLSPARRHSMSGTVRRVSTGWYSTS
jgi:DNA-binding beta-propeller fold protein YncE